MSYEALSWDDLARLYDAERGNGRPARTLPLEAVMRWAENQPERFFFSEEGTIHERQPAAPQQGGGAL